MCVPRWTQWRSVVITRSLTTCLRVCRATTCNSHHIPSHSRCTNGWTGHMYHTVSIKIDHDICGVFTSYSRNLSEENLDGFICFAKRAISHCNRCQDGCEWCAHRNTNRRCCFLVGHGSHLASPAVSKTTNFARSTNLVLRETRRGHTYNPCLTSVLHWVFVSPRW